METALEGLRWIADHYGLYAAIVVYFIARDTHRDWKQGKVINDLQTEMRHVILPLVEKNANVITENTVTLKSCTKTLEESKNAIQDCRKVIHECKLLLEG